MDGRGGQRRRQCERAQASRLGSDAACRSVAGAQKQQVCPVVSESIAGLLPQPKSRNQRLPEPGWRQPGDGPAATAGERERDGKMRARARGGSLLQIQLLKTREVGQDRGEGGGALRADIVRAVCMWREKDKATREDGRETHKSR